MERVQRTVTVNYDVAGNKLEERTLGKAKTRITPRALDRRTNPSSRIHLRKRAF
jgi:hypothetical protein